MSAKIWPFFPGVGRMLADVVRCWPAFDQHPPLWGPKLAIALANLGNTWPTWPEVGQVLPSVRDLTIRLCRISWRRCLLGRPRRNYVPSWPNWDNGVLHELVKFGPKLAKVDAKLAALGPNLADLARQFGRVWPILAELGPNLVVSGSMLVEFGQAQSGFGRNQCPIRVKSAQDWSISGQFLVEVRRAEIGRIGPNLGPNLPPTWPIWVEIVPDLGTFGQRLNSTGGLGEPLRTAAKFVRPPPIDV